MSTSIAAAIRRLDPPPVILILFGCIGLLTIGGAYDALIRDTLVVDLQGELLDGFSVPPLFSGGLLLGVSAYSVLLATGPDAGVAPRWAWGVFSVLFLEAAADETATIHERLGEALNVEWLVLYTPLFLVAGALWVIVLRGLRDRPERALWLGGAACWVVAQMLEAYAYGGTEVGRPGTGVFSALEELLEMTGSLLLLWTVLSLHRRARKPLGADAIGRAERLAEPAETRSTGRA
jgi:hypothetical protein